MNTILSLDIGTTTIGVVALDMDSEEVVHTESAANTASVPGLARGRHEQDTATILGIAKHLLARTAAHIREQAAPDLRIRAVAVTGQMHGIMPVDSSNLPRGRLITWRDQRAAGSPVLQGVADDDRRAKRCGCRLRPGYGFATLHSLIADDARLAAGLKDGDIRVCGITDYVAAYLSDCLVTDHSMAASWGGLNIRSLDWDRGTLDALQIPWRALPPLRASAEPIGPISSTAAHELGLDPDVLVCAGTGDHQASVLGCRPVAIRSCVVNVGTSGQVSVLTAKPDHWPHLETRPLVDGHYLVTGASLCGGWSYEYLAKFFRSVVLECVGQDIDQDAIYEAMNRIGARAAEDADGLLVDPLFLGSRNAPRTRGSVTGIDVANLTPSNLVRATANGIVQELFTYFEMTGRRVRRVHATGNAILRNPLLVAAIARRWRVEPVIAAQRETAAYGAACLGALRMGLVEGSWLID